MSRATILALVLCLLAAAHPEVSQGHAEVSQGRRASAAEVTVEVGDFFFCSASQPVGTCETVITAGDTVRWAYNQGTEGHTVTHCGDSCASPTGAPLFNSGALNTGGSFAFTFDTPGRYLYYCVFHPPFMQAAVVVQPPQPTAAPTATAAPTPEPATPAPTVEPPAPTPAPSATRKPSAAPTRSPSPTVALVITDEGDGGGGSTPWLIAGALIAGAAVAAAGGYALWRRRAA